MVPLLFPDYLNSVFLPPPLPWWGVLLTTLAFPGSLALPAGLVWCLKPSEPHLPFLVGQDVSWRLEEERTQVLLVSPVFSGLLPDAGQFGVNEQGAS